MEQRFFNPDWRRLGAAQPGGTGVIKRPVEQRMLTVAGSKHSQGTLKLWCDVLTMEEAKKNPPVNIRPPPPEPFELRLVIWDASEMESLAGWHHTPVTEASGNIKIPSPGTAVQKR